ncbi:MAG: diguanylate cyclase [Rhodoferax sp.]|uniref:diguanylate cyclase domain-containing protein n=1 Tax=Rhodoferax sp. TaxID=50421 RepID=UPI00260EC87D|nr:diguanylate cyclase [Rhodoferax sp.]MDD2880311.1 diguanylate cyclase [Rhodoferax sp.]
MNHLSQFPPPKSGTWPRLLLVGVVYFLLWMAAWYSARLHDQLGAASLWFLPAGLRFAIMFVMGWRGLLLEMVTVLVVSAFQYVASGSAWPQALSAQMFWLLLEWMTPVFAYAVVIFPLRSWMRSPLDFARPLHNALFLGAALVSSTLAALGGTFGLTRIGAVKAEQFTEVVTTWLTGDFIGIITFSPLLLVVLWPGLTRYLQQGHWPSRRSPTALNNLAEVQVVLMSVLALLVVLGVPWNFGLTRHLPFFALLLLLPLAWGALRWGLRSAVLTVVVLETGLVLLIALVGQEGMALRYQLVMMAIALVGLWLGGAVEARNRVLQRYRDFANVSNDLLWEVDAQGHLLEVSGRLAKFVPIFKGQAWQQVLAQGSPSHLAALERTLARQQPFHHLEIALLSRGRPPRWIQLNGQPAWGDAGELLGYRGTAIDVTRARRARTLLRSYNKELLEQVAERTHELCLSNIALENKKRHLQVLLAAAPVGVMELDEADACRYLNTNACLLTGFTQESAQGRALLDFVHAEDRALVAQAWRASRQSEGVQGLEFRLQQTQVWVCAGWISLNPADAALTGTLLVLTDATARRQHDEALWALAHHDTLTNLPNRSLFKDRCDQALSLAKRQAHCAAVLWLDLDGFKAVNDGLGHAAGDALLQQVAQRLKSRMRDSDTVARMGGDEFAVVMPDIFDATQAQRLATELVAQLAQPFDLSVGMVHISVSIGVAVYPQDASTVDGLIRCADLAMYSAKRSGKNKGQSWQDSGLAPLA